MRRAVVVGAGLAGLVSACRLADIPVAGSPEVLLLDASGRLGGRAHTTDADGFLLNLGPHALAVRGPGTAVLRGLGVELPGGNPLRRLPRALVAGKVESLLGRRGPGPRALSAMTRLARADLGAGTSVAAALDAATSDPAARAWLSAMARLALYADDEAHLDASLLAEAMAAGSVRYLDGGWGALVARLREEATRRGVEIRAGAPVRAVRVGPGGVTGVAAAAGDIEADAVVLAVGGPVDTAALLPEPWRSRMLAHAAVTRPARLACLDVALRGPLPTVGVILGVDEPTYLSEHSRVAALAPAGGVVLQAARFLPPGGEAPRDTRALLEGVLDTAAPGWRAQVVHERYLPGLVVTHDLPGVTRGGIDARHPVTVDGIAGLAIAGDWVGRHGMLAQAAIASAAAAAEHAARSAPTSVGAGR